MDYSRLWAKTSDNGAPTWHPLILHLLDVALCADAILQREPKTTRRSDVMMIFNGQGRR